MPVLFSRKSFTLIEILVAVVIVGILATLALPQFAKAVYISRFGEVYSVVETVSKAKHIWYSEHGFYNKNDAGSPGRYGLEDSKAGHAIDPSASPVQQDLGIEIPSTCYFEYVIYPIYDLTGPGALYAVRFRDPQYTGYPWQYYYDTGQWRKLYATPVNRPDSLYFNPPQ
ncbi:MAG: type II secretion system protein [Candidatus Omnitrophica bacterium]|nr:type II secretion system protein [Candidatus Omnitrophota bacterium]